MYKKVCCTCKFAFLLIRPIVVFSPFSLPLLLCITWFYILFVPTINIIKSFSLLPWLNLYNYYYCCQWSKKIIWFWNKHCSWMSTTLKMLAKIWENRCCGTLFEAKNIQNWAMETLTVILELINYSCKQKPINDNHLGQVDESQYLMKQPKKHHVFIWDETWFSSEIKHLHFNETFYWLTQLIHKQYYMKTMFMLSCSLLLSVPRWQLHGRVKV